MAAKAEECPLLSQQDSTCPRSPLYQLRLNQRQIYCGRCLSCKTEGEGGTGTKYEVKSKQLKWHREKQAVAIKKIKNKKATSMQHHNEACCPTVKSLFFDCSHQAFGLFGSVSQLTAQAVAGLVFSTHMILKKKKKRISTYGQIRLVFNESCLHVFRKTERSGNPHKYLIRYQT